MHPGRWVSTFQAKFPVSLGQRIKSTEYSSEKLVPCYHNVQRHNPEGYKFLNFFSSKVSKTDCCTSVGS